MILGRRAYRRHLPHYQSGGRTYFVTFVTRDRWCLPSEARSIALQHILIEHGWRAWIQAAVVMPDHAHVLLTPLTNARNEFFALQEIVKGIKGSSARSINKVLRRSGRVWQKESLDHELRHDESARQKGHYICENPVRNGLCMKQDEYPWIWREWIEGQKT
jgi:REP-associated tyrosine transposase